MTRILEEDYAYATARVRAIERRLTDASGFDRLIDAETTDDAMKQLMESCFGDGTDAGRQGWEMMLDQEPERVLAFLAGLMPHPEILDLFRLRDDYLNAKRLLKMMYQGQDLTAFAGKSGGTVPVPVLLQAIVERRYGTLPDIMGEAVSEAMTEFGKKADPRDIDLVLDRAVFLHMNTLAAEIGNPFLTELVALMTDMANIRIAIRGKLTGEARDFFQKAILSGGSIDPARFRAAVEKPLEAFVESIRITWFGEAAISGMEGYKAGRGISWLEKLLEDRLMVFVQRARYTAMGVEAMVGHLLARETEIRNVRIVMTGKVNGLSQTDIRERLRLTYV